MSTATAPGYVILFFLIALGGLLPQYPMLAESGVVKEDASSAMSDIGALISNNALEVSRLAHLYQNLLKFVTESPCLESYYTNNVSSVMADGFKEAAETIKEVQYSVSLLKLMKWRLKFVNSLDKPEIHADWPCPLPFFMLDGECIYLEGKVKRSFNFAKITCDIKGGFLAEPANITAFTQHLKKMTPGRTTEVYIGLQAPRKDEPLQWTTSGEQINEDFDVDTLDANDGDPYCVTIKDSKYFGLPCVRQKHFVCEIALPTEAEP